MVIYFGGDHRGFELKRKLFLEFRARGYEVVDLGAHEKQDWDDYPDYAKAVALQVSRDFGAKGVLVCSSGGGMAIAAGKIKGVRASVGFSADQVFDLRHDDDLNVLCLASEFVSEGDAVKIVDVFLKTPFVPEEKYTRRLEKITQIEYE